MPRIFGGQIWCFSLGKCVIEGGLDAAVWLTSLWGCRGCVMGSIFPVCLRPRPLFGRREQTRIHPKQTNKHANKQTNKRTNTQTLCNKNQKRKFKSSRNPSPVYTYIYIYISVYVQVMKCKGEQWQGRLATSPTRANVRKINPGPF